MSLRSIAKSILPQPLIRLLKRAPRRMKWLSRRTRGVSTGKDELVQGLTAL